jgi:hypothetical protein
MKVSIKMLIQYFTSRHKQAGRSVDVIIFPNEEKNSLQTATTINKLCKNSLETSKQACHYDSEIKAIIADDLVAIKQVCSTYMFWKGVRITHTNLSNTVLN